MTQKIMKIITNMLLKIHSSQIIHGSSGSNQALNLIIDKIKRTILWENVSGVVIKTTAPNTLTLANMPSLSSHIGKTLILTIGYSNDSPVEFSCKITTLPFFFKYSRDMSGNDLWEVLFNVSGLINTSWVFKTFISYSINSAGVVAINAVNNNIKLYKVELIG